MMQVLILVATHQKRLVGRRLVRVTSPTVRSLATSLKRYPTCYAHVNELYRGTLRGSRNLLSTVTAAMSRRKSGGGQRYYTPKKGEFLSLWVCFGGFAVEEQCLALQVQVSMVPDQLAVLTRL